MSERPVFSTALLWSEANPLYEFLHHSYLIPLTVALLLICTGGGRFPALLAAAGDQPHQPHDQADGAHGQQGRDGQGHRTAEGEERDAPGQIGRASCRERVETALRAVRVYRKFDSVLRRV